MLNGLDLFSGIGGLSLALEPWVRPIAYCENDRWAQALLLSRMSKGQLPRAAVWDDVRTLRGCTIPRVDIIYGGFPCQDISVAGRGVGLEGERSGLFFQVLRLIDECKPAFVFLENVPAIRTRGAERVCKELASRGYDLRWDVVSAAEVGAPHLRKRWFCLAFNADHRKQNPHAGVSQGPTAEPSGGGNAAHAEIEGLEGQRERPSGVVSKHENTGNLCGWNSEPNVGRVAHGIPVELDALGRLGVCLVQARKRTMNGESDNKKSDAANCELVGKVLRAMWENQELAKASPDLYAQLIYDFVPNLPQGFARKGGNVGTWIEKDEGLRRLWPAFLAAEQRQDVRNELLERIRSLERTEAVGPNRVDRLRGLGNAVVPAQAREAFMRLAGIIQ